jgi:hypothetical protein
MRNSLFSNIGTDNLMMSALSCCTSAFATLSRAAAKSAASRLRRMGLLSASADWARRATICESCPMRIIDRGISFCGRPLLQRVDREPSIHGCGCPCREKAKSPNEHCPLDWRHHPSQIRMDGCTCKWCNSYG